MERASKGGGEEGEVKYCPLLSAALKVLCPCVKEKCAWWDRLDEQCLIESLKYALRLL